MHVQQLPQHHILGSHYILDSLAWNDSGGTSFVLPSKESTASGRTFHADLLWSSAVQKNWLPAPAHQYAFEDGLLLWKWPSLSYGHQL